NCSITSMTCSRLMPLMVAIARPSFCTSLALMCLSTSAASLSPSDSSSTAARCSPVSSDWRPGCFISQPLLRHLGDPLRVGANGLAGVAQAVLVGIGGQRRRRLRGLQAELGRVLGQRGQVLAVLDQGDLGGGRLGFLLLLWRGRG